MHACMHAYIHTNIHTYIHTYKCMYTWFLYLYIVFTVRYICFVYHIWATSDNLAVYKRRIPKMPLGFNWISSNLYCSNITVSYKKHVEERWVCRPKEFPLVAVIGWESRWSMMPHHYFRIEEFSQKKWPDIFWWRTIRICSASIQTFTFDAWIYAFKDLTNSDMGQPEHGHVQHLWRVVFFINRFQGH